MLDPTAILNGAKLSIAAAQLTAITGQFQHIAASVAAVSGPDTIVGGAFTEDLHENYDDAQAELTQATTNLTALAAELQTQAATETAKGLAL